MTDSIKHVEFNCTTGEEHWRDATDDEVAELSAQQQAHTERTAAAHAQAQTDQELMRAEAAANPAYAALARRLGVIN